MQLPPAWVRLRAGLVTRALAGKAIFMNRFCATSWFSPSGKTSLWVTLRLIDWGMRRKCSAQPPQRQPVIPRLGIQQYQAEREQKAVVAAAEARVAATSATAAAVAAAVAAEAVTANGASAAERRRRPHTAPSTAPPAPPCDCNSSSGQGSVPSFVESPFTSKSQYEAWVKGLGAGHVAAAVDAGLALLRVPDRLGAALLLRLPLADRVRAARACSRLRGWAAASLRETTELRLDGCRGLTDGALSALGRRCAELHTLSCSGCSRLGAEGDEAIAELGRLGKLARLEHLDLTNTAVGTASLRAAAAACPRLCSLSLAGSKLGDALPDELAADGLARLERLNLSGTRIGDGALATLARRCPALASLNCSRCERVGDDGVIMVAVRCTQLRALHLARCLGLSDAALAAMGDFAPALEEVHLAGCVAVTDRGVCALARGCAQLQRLSLDSVCVSDAGLEELGRSCPRLCSLQAQGCTGITDDGLEALVAGCAQLAKLDVRGCRQVTDLGVVACEERLPSCKVMCSPFERQGTWA